MPVETLPKDTKAAGKVPAKPDPKAAKPAPGKGAVVDDKNAPKLDFKVDYPDVEAEPNFIIMEKTFNQAAPAKAPAERKKKKDTEPKQAITVEQKKAIKQKELTSTYDAVRALPFSMAVVLRLNQPVEMKPPTTAVSVEPVASAVKKVEPAKPVGKK